MNAKAAIFRAYELVPKEYRQKNVVIIKKNQVKRMLSLREKRELYSINGVHLVKSQTINPIERLC